MTVDRLDHRFTTSVPDNLEPGVLYVSLAYDTTIHLCACGCGNQVVLPLHPTAWKLTYDGDTVSMSPSVGNWSFPCRSHYWIGSGRVHWSTAWSDAQVRAGRERTLDERGMDTGPSADAATESAPPLWRRLRHALAGFVRRS
jgi:hypothetical protein